MKTTLYDIPSCEIPALLTEMGAAYYWRPAAETLLYWDGTWHSTDLTVGTDPLSTLPRLDLDQPVFLNGLLDLGFTPQLTHQIIDAHLQNHNQSWILRWPQGDIPPDLHPFVQLHTWPLPKATAIATLLEAQGCYTERLLRACLGLHLSEITRLVASPGDKEALVAAYKQRQLTSRGVLQIPQPDCAAVGCETVLGIIDRVTGLLSPAAEQAGLPFPKGMILMGPPGTGKSLIAKTAATRLAVPLVCADWGGLLSPEPGESEANLRHLIATAEAAAPCVLFFDDFDKAFTSGDLSRENGTEKRLAGYLLTWLQERQRPVFTIVTCNRIAQLPPELKRRFDWQIFVDLPHEGNRYLLFQIHLQKFCATVPPWDVLVWKQLISAYNETTPDEIAKAVQQAAISAFERGTPSQITPADLLAERQRFTPANLANPEQIELIRLSCRYALKAASADNSEFRVEPVESFRMLMG